MPVYVGATPTTERVLTITAPYARPLTRYDVYLYGTGNLPRRVDVAAGDDLVVPNTAYVESYGVAVGGTRPPAPPPPPPPPAPPLIPKPTLADAGKILVASAGGTRYELAASDVAGDAHYPHTQSVAAATWTIPHNLGKFPAVTVVDSAGTEVVGDVTHPDENTVVVSFTAAFAGRAYCN